MAKEIERKFLTTSDAFKNEGKAYYFHQGYLCVDQYRVVRVRIEQDEAFITVKSFVSERTRMEYQYPIPMEDAQEMLDNLCQKPTVEKHRYKVPYKGFVWEVDVFHGENEGLVVAEIELEHEEQEFEKPEWVGEEVSHDVRYYNFNLAQHPYKDWNDQNL